MDTQSLPCRLKSARRKRRLVIEGRDKELLRLNRRYNKLFRAKLDLPWVPLEQPYQRGWKRFFVLKPDVAQSDKAAFYQGILDKINTTDYHYDESFKQTKRGKRFHRYNSERRPQTLRPIYWYEWQQNKLNLTDEERACFSEVYNWNDRHNLWTHQFVFTKPWLFELKVEPNMITQVKMVDAGLERELSFIDVKVWKGKALYRMWKLTDSNYKNWQKRYHEQLKYKNPLKNIPVYLAEDYA